MKCTYINRVAVTNSTALAAGIYITVPVPVWGKKCWFFFRSDHASDFLSRVWVDVYTKFLDSFNGVGPDLFRDSSPGRITSNTGNTPLEVSGVPALDISLLGHTTTDLSVNLYITFGD